MTHTEGEGRQSPHSHLSTRATLVGFCADWWAVLAVVASLFLWSAFCGWVTA